MVHEQLTAADPVPIRSLVCLLAHSFPTIQSLLSCLEHHMDLAPLYKMASATGKRYPDQTLLPPPTTHSTAAEIHAATTTDHPHRRHHAHLLSKVHISSNRPLAGGIQFAGRLGGNQSFVLDRSDPLNAALLARVPDAAPYMTISSQLSPHGFLEPDLWRAALLEGIATLLLSYLTIFASLSPSTAPLPPTPRYGPFNNAAFIGPVVGAVVNWLTITLFTFTFSPITGAHLNPTITLATFFARLTTLPRATLYIAAQALGGSLAGLLIRGTLETTHFKAGGCYLFTDLVVCISQSLCIPFRLHLLLPLSLSCSLLPHPFPPSLTPQPDPLLSLHARTRLNHNPPLPRLRRGPRPPATKHHPPGRSADLRGRDLRPPDPGDVVQPLRLRRRGAEPGQVPRRVRGEWVPLWGWRRGGKPVALGALGGERGGRDRAWRCICVGAAVEDDTGGEGSGGWGVRRRW
jgi:hypothetical protein